MSDHRSAGVTLPLFSIRTRRDWGIGQIGDMPACGAWIRRAGHRVLQILPPYELACGESSPYGARTAFGLDPVYVTLEDVEDLDAAAIDEALGAEGIAERTRLRGTRSVEYEAVRRLKGRVLHRAFERFVAREWDRGTARAKELAAFIDRERAWADDLALYVALRDAHDGWGWTSWPAEERDREARAMARTRDRLAPKILEHHYAQWIAHTQWDRARAKLRGLGVDLMGDLPFVVCAESADVWSRKGEFRLDVSLGAPPDAFAPDGQDWGLPAYDWAAMQEGDFAWLRARTRHATRLYDRFRLDHVVGYFRSYVRKPGERGSFDPEREDAQRVHGQRVLRAILEEARAGGIAHHGTPTEVIAEDLGVIPPWVRETLRELGVPGYKVIPWEKEHDWLVREPAQFAPVSVATWSTHDTAPVTAWWDDFAPHEKEQIARLAGFEPELATIDDDARLTKLLDLLFTSGSNLTLALVQELLGQRDRINTPGTVTDANWTYRLPKPIEDLEADDATSARMARIAEHVRAAGRV